MRTPSPAIVAIKVSRFAIGKGEYRTVNGGRLARQMAGLFVAEERGSHQLKGVPEPVTLFRIVRASGGGRRAGSAISRPS